MKKSLITKSSKTVGIPSLRDRMRDPNSWWYMGKKKKPTKKPYNLNF
jgi:hypothetical protein